jgi:F-type H+-transporting ATPase subunit b
MLSEGRARLTAEIAELEARAEADQAAAASRVGDELRTEISRLAAEVSDRLLADTLDDSAQQALIENFIQKVGSSS